MCELLLRALSASSPSCFACLWSESAGPEARGISHGQLDLSESWLHHGLSSHSLALDTRDMCILAFGSCRQVLFLSTTLSETKSEQAIADGASHRLHDVRARMADGLAES